MKRIELFNKSSTGKTKCWAIWTESGGYVCREWGYLDGAIQTTKDLVKQKNKGKSNETSLDEQAELEAKRILEKKTDEGYTAFKDLETPKKLINWATAEISPLFAPSKPEVKISDEDEAALIASGNCIWQRKFNGMCVVIIKGDETTRIYSRRLEDKSANFPRLVNAINYNVTICEGTIFHGELEVNDNPDLAKEVFGSHPETSLQRQAELALQGITPKIRLFDCLYIDYKDVTPEPYSLRYQYLPSLFTGTLNWVLPVENYTTKPEVPENWEGLVCRDISSRTFIRQDAKPNRKSGAWKQKRFEVDDVVAYKWLTGRGKNNNRPAKLLIGTYLDNGDFLEMGEAGSGLCESHKDDLLSGRIKLPVSIELKYEKVSPKKVFILPIFKGWREDKPVTECLFSELKEPVEDD